jgi:hypothetical protein
MSNFKSLYPFWLRPTRWLRGPLWRAINHIQISIARFLRLTKTANPLFADILFPDKTITLLASCPDHLGFPRFLSVVECPYEVEM